jgi:hypothetical protein
MAPDRSGLTPHRRKHWSVEPAAQPEAPRGAVRPPKELLSPEETRVEAKRLLWRDSAIILVGIVLALLAAEFLPGLAPGLVADQSAPASDAGGGPTLEPEGSTPLGPTLGPVVDPSLAIDATQPPIPPPTLPPTGSFDPADPGDPTPRPTRKPRATPAPATPAPTAEPTPEVTPDVTEPPPPTEPPPTEPPPTEEPTQPA